MPNLEPVTLEEGEATLVGAERELWDDLDSGDVVADISLKYTPELARLARRKAANRPPDFDERDRKASNAIRAASKLLNFQGLTLLFQNIMRARVERNRIATKALALADALDAHPEYGDQARDLKMFISDLREAGDW